MKPIRGQCSFWWQRFRFTCFHEVFPIFNINYFKGMQSLLLLGLFLKLVCIKQTGWNIHERYQNCSIYEDMQSICGHIQSIRGQCSFRGQRYTWFRETLPISKIFTLIANKLPKHGYFKKITNFTLLYAWTLIFFIS